MLAVFEREARFALISNPIDENMLSTGTLEHDTVKTFRAIPETAVGKNFYVFSRK